MTTRTILKRTLAGIATFGLGLTMMTASALTISPARAELTGDPGETIIGSLLLINEQDSDQTFYTSVENFESQGESGTPNFTASKVGLPTWIQVQEKVTLKKGERMSVPYSVVIPTDADSGGHFAAIFLSTVPPSLGDGQVSVGAKVGMLVLLKVTGTIKEEGGLSSFALKSGKKVQATVPVDFVYKFKNDGNDRVNPEGAIVIKNMFGGEIAHLDANVAKGNILPGSTRRFDIRYGDVDAPAVSAPFMDQVKFQMSNFALGMYTATISMTFGNKGVASSSLTYYMFPWQLLSIVLGIILVLVIILVSLLKRYNRWIIKQARGAK